MGIQDVVGFGSSRPVNASGWEAAERYTGTRASVDFGNRATAKGHVRSLVMILCQSITHSHSRPCSHLLSATLPTGPGTNRFRYVIECDQSAHPSESTASSKRAHVQTPSIFVEKEIRLDDQLQFF